VAIDREGLDSWLAGIREVLKREWDPIGVLPYGGGPEDEYDSYRDKLAGMISAGATDEELLAYLEWAEREWLGLAAPADERQHRETLRRVISAIRALSPPPRSN